ncbi:MAG: hypothetical protein US92_C0002G0003 [Candidatus Peregrinibacteria bacterium GW2011_GWA2_38_36]|nr:MAG: hypothetical protein US92_C0002G0003 [Candidatus Peregrinibacteria bacterium GW2011_GWA2_38_36]
MMKKIVAGVLMLAVVFVAGCSVFGTSDDAASKPKIAVILPFTGDAGSYGEMTKQGIEIAAKEFGYAGEVIYEDSKCDPKDSVNAMTKLVSVDKVQAVIGDLCSSATRASYPIAEQYKVVLVSPASTNPDISKDGDYMFRTIPSDSLQGAFGAKLVYDKGYRNLAVLYSNEDYGIGFNTVLKENFEKLGGKVVASEGVERTATDARTQITKIKAANPDAVYFIHNGPSVAAGILRQMSELGLKAFIVGSEGLRGDAILKGAGVSAEGLYVTSVTSGTSDFMTQFKATYNNVEAGPFAAQGYDAFKAIALTIKDGAKTGEEIKEALYKVEFDGGTGHVKFDANGDVPGTYDVFVVKNGKFELVK